MTRVSSDQVVLGFLVFSSATLLLKRITQWRLQDPSMECLMYLPNWCLFYCWSFFRSVLSNELNTAWSGTFEIFSHETNSIYSLIFNQDCHSECFLAWTFIWCYCRSVLYFRGYERLYADRRWAAMIYLWLVNYCCRNTASFCEMEWFDIIRKASLCTDIMQIATDDLYDINYNSVDFTRTTSIYVTMGAVARYFYPHTPYFWFFCSTGEVAMSVASRYFFAILFVPESCGLISS